MNSTLGAARPMPWALYMLAQHVASPVPAPIVDLLISGRLPQGRSPRVRIGSEGEEVEQTVGYLDPRAGLLRLAAILAKALAKAIT